MYRTVKGKYIIIELSDRDSAVVDRALKADSQTK